MNDHNVTESIACALEARPQGNAGAPDLERTAALASALSRPQTLPPSVLAAAKARIAGHAPAPVQFQVLMSVPESSEPQSHRTMEPTLRRWVTWSGWAAAAVFAVLWTGETKLRFWSRDTLNAGPTGSRISDRQADPAMAAEGADSGTEEDPNGVVGVGNPSTGTGSKRRGPVASATRDAVTVLRQDVERLKREIGALQSSQAATLVPDPRVARPTVIQLGDPSAPAGTDRPLSERIGPALERELEPADAGNDAKPDAEAKPPLSFIDRTGPPVATFELPVAGLEEIGGGYFYNRSQNLIMEPTGDGRTYNYRQPGPDFDPENPRLAPVKDLSTRQPVSDSPPPVVVPPVPQEAEPEHLGSGYVWVDQTTGEGTLILPPGIPEPEQDSSYWLWMTVPGRDTPIAVGQVESIPPDGGSLDFSLPQAGLIPGSFVITREATGSPATPSSNILLKGP